MLLSDSIIAGRFIGASGVAGINAITPVTAIVTFFGDLLSTGVGIAFTREVGAMRNPPSCGYSIAGSGRDLLADG